jgi:hypothetical protein
MRLFRERSLLLLLVSSLWLIVLESRVRGARVTEIWKHFSVENDEAAVEEKAKNLYAVAFGGPAQAVALWTGHEA